MNCYQSRFRDLWFTGFRMTPLVDCFEDSGWPTGLNHPHCDVANGTVLFPELDTVDLIDGIPNALVVRMIRIRSVIQSTVDHNAGRSPNRQEKRLRQIGGDIVSSERLTIDRDVQSRLR